MEYLSLDIEIFSQEQSDILMAMLEDYPFESFEQESDSLRAYIQQKEYDGCKADVEQLLAQWGVKHFSTRIIEQQNWNSEWESDFEPVEVTTADGRAIMIRAEHHTPPEGDVIDVVVAPRMSFGTGHHITTALMSQSIAEMDKTCDRALDMGCGTGVLAIVALKSGRAKSVVAVDIDDWACESCRDSALLSGVAESIDVRCGSIDVVASERVDAIFANINRNILLMMMTSFGEMLPRGGKLLMSGFLVEDVAIIRSAAEREGFAFVAQREREGWAVVECVKC
ncbi:MAG: 50S ribosomal protein L11 methyltransferase [Rikenellaceae bacterium]|nr:50S ribosomal protein L11 methyltransferase [Rikenellaceae bacterium]